MSTFFLFSHFVIQIIIKYIFQVKIDRAVFFSSIKFQHLNWVFLYLTCRWRWPFFGISKHWHYRWKPQTLWTPVRQGWQFHASSPGRPSPRAPMSERCQHNLTLHGWERPRSFHPAVEQIPFIHLCTTEETKYKEKDFSSVYRQHSRCSSHCFSSTRLSLACCWQLFQKPFKMELQNCFRIT